MESTAARELVKVDGVRKVRRAQVNDSRLARNWVLHSRRFEEVPDQKLIGVMPPLHNLDLCDHVLRA